MRTILAAVCCLGVLLPHAAAEDDAVVAQVAERFLSHVESVPGRMPKLAQAERAEDHCWLTFPQLSMPLSAYELTGEAAYLDMFVECFGVLKERLTKGPDGYLGWYGKPLGTFAPRDRPDVTTDVTIVSFRCVDMLSRFVELTGKDPALARKYSAVRREYVDLMTKHLAGKWMARGNFTDLGRNGAILRSPDILAPTKASLTQPHNKHAIAVHALLRLHRVTGEDAYMRAAIKLGTRFKRSLILKDGHYEWHYWDPAGAWDVHPDDPAKWKHWINVEHKGGYYASSLGQAIALYQHGLVFDETDLTRFLKTQLEMCWNGSVDAPKWARCDGTTSRKYMKGAYMCSALAPYDDSIRTFCYGPGATAEKLKSSTHSWQGGPAMQGWLLAKKVRLEELQRDPQPYAAVGRKFLSNPSNRTFYESLRFEVTGNGYRTPHTPADMKNMPTVP